MTKALDDALETVRRFPPEVQDRAAQMLLSYVDGDERILALSREEEADLEEALAEMERGELATAANAETVFAKYRL